MDRIRKFDLEDVWLLWIAVLIVALGAKDWMNAKADQIRAQTLNPDALWEADTND